MPTLPDLVDELKTLRKGRGLFVSHIDERVGATLRSVCAVTEEDGPAQIRQKVLDRLEFLSRNLPADLRVAVMAAFAIAPDARLPLYQDRVSWAATKLNRDPRTARRRIDDGIHHIAQLAAADAPTTAARPTASAWRNTEVRAALALDRRRPEVLQYRRIVAEWDGLDELDLAMTVDPPTGSRPPLARDIGIDLFHGGTLVARRVESTDRFAFSLVLPRPLVRGESHDFALQFRLPRDQPMRPHFVCVLRQPCDLLDLRVRFDRRRLPAAVWSLRHVSRDGLDRLTPVDEHASIDHAGETRVVFRDLTPDLAYGVGWDD